MSNKLKIYLNTGTAWLESIIVEGTINDDIIELIDDYYSENGTLPVTLYTLNELQEIYTDIEELDAELENMIPINGGEYYIEGISHIEEIK